MKMKRTVLLFTLSASALLASLALSKVARSQEVAFQQEHARQVEQPTSSLHRQEKEAPYRIVPVSQRRLSQETIDQIDNLTIQQFVQFYNDTGLDADTIDRVYFVNTPDDYWVLPSNEYREGEFPIIGFRRDGADQGWDNYLDGNKWTQLSYADHTKSATIGQIREAIHDYFKD